ncbi:glycosyltransferase family 2 protein [Lachnospiraceae bacterium 47-T17]
MGEKLSVIVPVYNVEPYIKRCLESLVNQTYKNLEIILVDDGSTDTSGAVCDEYARHDQRIRVVHKENGGIASARKAGIVYATGKYTTNVDPDDWIEEDAYEYMAQKLDQYKPDMLILGYKKEHAGFVEEYRQWLEEGLYEGQQFWDAFNRCVEAEQFFCQPLDMSLCNKAVRTDLWKKYQLACPEALKKNVDDAVIFPCLMNIKSIYVDSRCFYHYCVRSNSILWGNKQGDYERFIILSRHLIQTYGNAIYRDKIDKNFLLYKLFYQFILDTPEKMIGSGQCMIYPQVKPGSRIIIYGKGVFANRLIQRINELQFCEVADNVDKSDLEKVIVRDADSYDYIVIAILNFLIVKASRELLISRGIGREKILCIDKEKLSFQMFPEPVKESWNAWIQEESRDV